MPKPAEHKIRRRLQQYRSLWSVEFLRRAILLTVSVGLALFGLFTTAEALRYFSNEVRLGMLWVGAGILVLVFCFSGLWIALVRRGVIPSFSDLAIARRLGKQFPQLGDRVLNALALLNEDSTYGYSPALIDLNLNDTADKLNSIDLHQIISGKTRRRLRQILAGMTVFFFIIWLPFAGSIADSATRLFHPGIEYTPPKPFDFRVSPGHTQVLDRDSFHISVTVEGESPDQVFLTKFEAETEHTLPLKPDTTGQYQYVFDKVHRSFEYQIHGASPHWWDRWDRIASEKFAVDVLSRPQIQSLTIRLVPPEYSGLPTKRQPITSTEIAALKGSRIHLEAVTNKSVAFAGLVFREASDTLSFDIHNPDITSVFTLQRPDRFTIHLEDHQGVNNINPATYRLTPLPDESPRVEILQPPGDVDLGESLQIPLRARLQDDFGFSSLAIEYQIEKPAALDHDSTWKAITLPLEQVHQKAYEYSHLWDLHSLQLSPRDVVRYRLALWDNDAVSGPKVDYSDIQTARFPSLGDMFARNHQQQSAAIEDAEEIQEMVSKIKKQVDDLTLEMQKKEELTWQQQQQAEEIQQSHKDLKKHLEELSKQLEQIQKQSEKHKLYSDNVMEKYQQLQQMFRDVMTPELQEALDRLRQAMEQTDPEEVRKAMENLQGTQEDLEENIDRALQLFKRVNIEQQMEEVVRRIEELADQQQDITNAADSADANPDALGQKEQAASDEYEMTEKRMEELSSMMEEFPIMPSEQMKQALQQAQSDSILKRMRKAQQQFRQGKMQQAKENSQQAQQQLQNLSNMLQNTQQQLQRQTMNEVLDEFRDILQNVLSLSQQQERLRDRTQPLQGHSPVMAELADEQQDLQMNLQHVVGKMVKLSQKTFGIDRNVGKSIGKTASKMQQAMQQLAERRAAQAANAQSESMAALNETAQQLVASMQSLQQQGSSTGFENYLKQMQQMAKQQQGLNQQSMQLGQQGQPSLAEQAAMQRMAVRQMALRKSLQQLQNEMARSGGKQGMGDLRGVGEEMEQVAKDLRQNRFTRETMERQQRILSRMLDAQKSLRTRDFSKKRESTPGEDMTRSSPDGLPADLGERRNVLQEDLDQALREGYQDQYERVIRNYFNQLATRQRQNQPTGDE